MKTAKSTFYLLNLLITSILLSGCGDNSIENKMYGTWDGTVSLANDYFKNIIEEPFSDVAEMKMDVEATYSFHKGGKYNLSTESTLQIKLPKGEITLRFFIKDAGEWSLHDDGKELVETSTDSVFTPLDEMTKAFMEKEPNLEAAFKPVKGETTTLQILSISDTTMEIHEPEAKLTYTLNKKD